MKKIITILIFVSTIVIGLSSCKKDEPFSGKADIFPKGYTCGFPYSRQTGKQIYWVENYDEFIENLNSLKSHNSTFKDGATLSYSGDLFDVKYSFSMPKDKTEFPVRWGESPYERQVYDVGVGTYIFFEDVSLESIYYGYIPLEHIAYSFNVTDEFNEILKNGVIPVENTSYEWDETQNTYYIYIDELKAFSIEYAGRKDFNGRDILMPDGAKELISDEVMQEIIGSIVYIGLND